MSDLISLRIDDRGVDADLARLLAKVGNTRPVMREISHDMRDAVLENFEREGRPSPWKKSRRAAKQGGRTLQHTRRLMKSITPDSSVDTARVGTNLKYAAIHHFGGPAGRKSKPVQIPARPYMFLLDADLARVITRMKRYLEN